MGLKPMKSIIIKVIKILEKVEQFEFYLSFMDFFKADFFPDDFSNSVGKALKFKIWNSIFKA